MLHCKILTFYFLIALAISEGALTTITAEICQWRKQLE
jgi:hypothetical protein